MSLPILIYADGACSGNPGPGGWGSIVIFPGANGYAKVVELGGFEQASTNNRMELTAVGKALRYLDKTPGTLRIHSDSKYVIEGITKWVKGWKARGWKKADGGEVLNLEFWKRLIQLVAQREQVGTIDWRYVKGHSGDPGNDRCDEIAVAYSKGESIELFSGSLQDYPIDLKIS